MSIWHPRFLTRTRTLQPVRPCHLSYPALYPRDDDYEYSEKYWADQAAAEAAEDQAENERMWTTQGKVRVGCVGCDREMFVPLLCAASPAYCGRYTWDCSPW
jgi:hypothetical protein